jgi:hypothetical protein
VPRPVLLAKVGGDDHGEEEGQEGEEGQKEEEVIPARMDSMVSTVEFSG